MTRYMVEVLERSHLIVDADNELDAAKDGRRESGYNAPVAYRVHEIPPNTEDLADD